MKKLIVVLIIFLMNIGNGNSETLSDKYNNTKNTGISTFFVFDLMSNHISKDVIYKINPEVLQIQSGGFLADVASGQNDFNSIIYVIASDSNKLLNGDHFDPYLPIKFTGQYFQYINFFGEVQQVPKFKIIMKKDAPNKDLPEHIKVMNERRAIYNKGNIYGYFR